MVKKGSGIKYLEGGRWIPATYLGYTKGGKSKIMTPFGIKELPSWKLKTFK